MVSTAYLHVLQSQALCVSQTKRDVIAGQGCIGLEMLHAQVSHTLRTGCICQRAGGALVPYMRLQQVPMGAIWQPVVATSLFICGTCVLLSTSRCSPELVTQPLCIWFVLSQRALIAFACHVVHRFAVWSHVLSESCHRCWSCKRSLDLSGS
jgi:hypothetical protein